MRKLIRTDGSETDLPQPVTNAQVRSLISAQALDTVMLRHLGWPQHVMLVDDLGHDRGLPVNEKATQLYAANCRPGTTHQIRGDVVVAPDGDFA